ncbi:PKD domain-containing protein [uncultured Methanoregula sp.]|uniref:PKD domain-containing protein n=1 Tax=uncultured Methanoregula sp. TaxID=1005933 RepID=UPI002AAAF4A3|nr:PKD domain-containing protein [uncultured Methanoregula sp.]
MQIRPRDNETPAYIYGRILSAHSFLTLCLTLFFIAVIILPASADDTTVTTTATTVPVTPATTSQITTATTIPATTATTTVVTTAATTAPATTTTTVVATTATTVPVTTTTTALPSPVAGFYGSPASGTLPLVVQFTDTSANTPTTWSWDFSDGNTSASQNPSNTYATAGNYTVSLTVTNAAGSDTATQTGYINVNSVMVAPVASFSVSGTTGTASLTIQFTDTSTNSP